MQFFQILVTLVIAAVAASSGGCASTQGPSQNNEDDQDAPTVEWIEIGGVQQAIYVTGRDPSLPVILVLHGGPGYAMMPLFHALMPELEDSYNVVNWDQRGAGLSYDESLPASSLTFERAVADAHELTLYLKARFGTDKLYLLGHSWGTMLGISLIKKYPGDYAAYIGTGQVANVVRNEQGSYAFALEMAQDDSNTEALEELEAVGPPDDEGQYASDDGPDVTMKWVGHYGGDVYGARGAEAIDALLLDSDLYADHRDAWLAGVDYSLNYFNDPKVWVIDFIATHADLPIKVAFFMGRHDYDTPAPLAEEYFDAISAPAKKLIWFENSAHFPFYEETAKFVAELKRFLAN